MTILNTVMMLVSAQGLAAVGAGLAMMGLLGAGIGMGLAIAKTMEAIARQPEMQKKFQGLMLLGLAFIETVIIFGFVGAILIIVL